MTTAEELRQAWMEAKTSSYRAIAWKERAMQVLHAATLDAEHAERQAEEARALYEEAASR